MKTLVLVYLSFFFSFLLIGQDVTLDIIEDESCECITNLDINNIELNQLDIVAQQCVQYSIIKNIDIFSQSLEVDSLMFLKDELEALVEKAESQVFRSLMTKCRKFKELFTILTETHLSGETLYEVTGTIVENRSPNTIFVSIDDGSVFMKFFIDEDTKGWFDKGEEIIGKTVTVKYKELKYYNTTTAKYKKIQLVTSFIWLDYFINVFDIDESKSCQVQVVEKIFKDSIIEYHIEMFDVYAKTGRFSYIGYYKIVEEINKVGGISEINYSIFKANNVSYLGAETPNVEYYPDIYQVKLLYKKEEEDKAIIEEVNIPKRELRTRWVAYKKRKSTLHVAKADVDLRFKTVLSYYASLGTYHEFLDAEHGYLSSSYRYRDDLKKYRELNAVLSSQNLNDTDSTAIEQKISVEETKRERSKAISLNPDTLVFENYYPSYFGVKIILDKHRSKTNKVFYKEYYKYAYQDDWEYLTILKMLVDTSSDSITFKISYKEADKKMPQLFFKKLPIHYTYSEKNDMLYEIDEYSNWHSRNIHDKIGRKISFTKEEKPIYNQLLARVLTLHISYDDWDRYIYNLNLLSKIRKGENSSFSEHEIERAIKSSKEAFKKLHLPTKLSSD